jgi:LysR family transcriptional regulator for metE and metH
MVNNPHLELRHLRTLAALRDTGSLVEAADRLHLTQSALSHQLNDLEARIGRSLFFRKTKPVRFTSAGQAILAAADVVLPCLQDAERALLRLAGGEKGRLHVAIECHSCFEWLMPAIERYRDAWPDVELDLASGFNFAALPALAQGDLDLVITSDPTGIDGIAYVPLFQYEAQLAVALDHPLARRDWVAPADLAGETLIVYPVDRARLDVFRSFLEPAGVEPARVRTAELTPVIVQLVASHRGVACLPYWVLHEYAQRRLVKALSLGEEGIWPTLHAAVRADDRAVPYVAAFIEIARRTCFENLVGVLPALDEHGEPVAA